MKWGQQMNYKSKFFIVGLLLIMFLSLSVISANENMTDNSGDMIGENSIKKFELNDSFDECVMLNSSIEEISQDAQSNDNFKENNVLGIKDDSEILSMNVAMDVTPVILDSNNWLKVNVVLDFSSPSSPIQNGELGKCCLLIDGKVASNYYTVYKDVKSRVMSDNLYYSQELSIQSNKIFSAGDYELSVQFFPHGSSKSSETFIMDITVYNNVKLSINSDYSKRKNIIKAVSLYGNEPFYKVKLKVELLDSLGKIISTKYCYTDVNGKCEYNIDKENGEYVLRVSLIDDSNLYFAETVSKDISLTAIGAIIIFDECKIEYGNKIGVEILNLKNYKPLKKVKIKVLFYISSKKYKTNYYYTDSDGYAVMNTYGDVGYHKIVISIADSNYNANKVSSKVKITKNYVGVSAKKVTGDSCAYFYLKAIVKNNFGKKVDSGLIKFTINGKTYKVKVNDGVATKKLKLSKGTYKYKATYIGKNYYSDSSSSKVIIKQAKSSYTVKNGKYSVKLNYKEYKKLKNKQKRYYMKWTGEYKYETKKYYVYKNVCYSEVWYSYDGSGADWNYYKDSYRTKSGWKWYGDSYTSYDDGYHVKYYNKYKKFVQKTVKRKVYMTVCYHHGGLHSTVWTKA